MPAIAVEISHNRKTGPVSATYSAPQTCPASCPLKNNGCYAFCSYHVRLIGYRLQKEAVGLPPPAIAEVEAEAIRALTGNNPLRIHVIGDCLDTLSAEIVGKAGADYPNYAWGHTHSWRDIPVGAWQGLPIRASCESMKQVEEAKQKGYKASVIVKGKTKGVTICPFQTHGIQCVRCLLCPKAKATIGFLPHGVGKQKVEMVIAQSVIQSL